MSAAPGFEVRTSANTPAPAAAAACDQRLERIAAEQRVDGRGVGAEPGDLAPRRRRRAEQRLRVGGGADRDVAALAVGDHQQPGARAAAETCCERRPAGRAEALEAGELRLDRDAGVAGGADQRDAVLGDRRGRGLGRLSGPSPDRRGSSPAGIRVEAEADLTAALLDERGEPVGEGRSGPSALDALLETSASGELRHLAARDRDPLAGARVDALARAALGDAELAEAGEADLTTAASVSVMPSRIESTASPAAFLLSKLPAICRRTQPWSLFSFLLLVERAGPA